MTLRRNSTKLLKAFGEDTPIIQSGGTHKYKNSLRSRSDPAALVYSGADSAAYSSINSETYNLAVSYFTKTGSSKDIAKALALVVYDTAKVNKTTVQRVLDDIRNGVFSIEVYNSMNALREKDTQQGLAETTINSSSYKAKEIRA